MVRICARVRIFGPGLWALICLGFLNRGARAKAMVPTLLMISFLIQLCFFFFLINLGILVD